VLEQLVSTQLGHAPAVAVFLKADSGPILKSLRVRSELDLERGA
jgi:hypothetical protein